jgi:hypothetical protein
MGIAIWAFVIIGLLITVGNIIYVNNAKDEIIELIKARDEMYLDFRDNIHKVNYLLNRNINDLIVLGKYLNDKYEEIEIGEKKEEIKE